MALGKELERWKRQWGKNFPFSVFYIETMFCFCTLEIFYCSFGVLYLLIRITYYLISCDVSYSSVCDLFLPLLSAAQTLVLALEEKSHDLADLSTENVTRVKISVLCVVAIPDTKGSKFSPKYLPRLVSTGLLGQCPDRWCAGFLEMCSCESSLCPLISAPFPLCKPY